MQYKQFEPIHAVAERQRLIESEDQKFQTNDSQSKMKTYDWVVHLRYSLEYLIFQAFLLVLIVLLLVLTISTSKGVPTQPFFLFLEIFVTSVLTFEIVLEIMYAGAANFFFPARNSRVEQFLLTVWNWLQMIIMVLSILLVGLIFYYNLADSKKKKSKTLKVDDEAILAVMIVRYVGYILFVASIQYRMHQSHGGMGASYYKLVLWSVFCCCCDSLHKKEKNMKDGWDIPPLKENTL